MNPIQIAPLSQRDGRWANQLLGKSTESRMGFYGCLMTSIAMALGTTPDTVNRELTAAGMMGTKDCPACLNTFYLLDKIPSAIGVPTVWISERHAFEPFPLKEQKVLFDYIMAGNVALIEVDGQQSIPGHQMHWVLAVGAFRIGEAFQFIVNDPWEGIQTLLSPTFGINAERALCRAVVYPITATGHTARTVKAGKAFRGMPSTIPTATAHGVKGDRGLANRRKGKA